MGKVADKLFASGIGGDAATEAGDGLVGVAGILVQVAAEKVQRGVGGAAGEPAIEPGGGRGDLLGLECRGGRPGGNRAVQPIGVG